jgi:hypothetical protein
MVTASLMGGLGNYMFQISTAFSLSLDNNDDCVFDVNDVFSPHKSVSSYEGNILRNVTFSNNVISTTTYREPTFQYSPIPYNTKLRLSGYFQSEKYFTHNRNHIISLFSIDGDSMDIITSKYGGLLSGTTCSIHVRRGDYLKLPNQHPVCELGYYLESISLIGDGVDFLIFSDDIPWCKENFKGDKFTFIDGNKDYIDMWLMSLCDHNIIANSSFSWWGAWLNTNSNKIIITPHKWFGSYLPHNTKDLTPKKWIKL